MAGVPGILGLPWVAEIDALLMFCARSVSTPGGRRERLDRRARFEIASARHAVEHVAPLFVPQSLPHPSPQRLMQQRLMGLARETGATGRSHSD